MGWLVALVGAIFILSLARGARAKRRAPPSIASSVEVDDLAAQGDQVELLRRYGTSDDAARLIADGRGDDLAGLGFRPGQ